MIGSDQVCDLDGESLGKPHTYERAVAQLTRMQGKRVIFHTAVCVIAPDGSMQETVSDTVITMRALGPETIAEYVRREQPYDCAGSAKSEGLGIALLDAIESDDPTALIGLPLIRTARLLRAAGCVLP